jgi:penicillin-binding protein 2
MRKKRIIALFVIMLLLFAGVDVRIARLTLNDGSVRTANTHGSYSLKINTSRGTIYDGKLKPIVNNGVKYVAAVSPQADAAVQLRALSAHVSDISVLEAGFEKGLPFTVTVDTQNINAVGVKVFTVPVRYAGDAVAPHITGYADSSGNGVTGIEKAFDDVLKKYTSGITETYAVDAKRRTLAGVTAATVITGNSSGGVVLTLDSDIQKSAQAAADKYLKSGSVIVMDVENGDILASVSEPGYSPLNVSSALKKTDSPLVNRVFKSYNLGSAFKIAVACAALESGIDKSFSYTCTGVVNVSGRDFHCEKLSGHGKEDMTLAFANSCNTYFITIGLKTGGEKILEMAKRLGFGTQTVFAPGLSSDAGTLPTEKLLSSPAAVANFSIGQGDLMVTPVQVACMVSAVANGGKLVTARLVKGIYDGEKMVSEYPNAVPERVISETIADEVSGFMIKTVNEGTGMPAKPAYGGAGGKTATAETGWLKNGKAINQAWFAGFYPAESPKYAIVVMCENGTAGGADAGPVFKYIADSLAPSCGYPAVSK